MRLVIIGGDAAGMSAASEARRRAPEAEIIVLEQTRDVSYGACGMPYKLPPGGRMDDLLAFPAERFRQERRIDLRLLHRVDRIQPEEHRLEGLGPDGPFELTYDRLILATGAQAVRPPIPGLAEQWGRTALPLKTLQDGRNWKDALARKPGKAVVIGGGYIGLEATEGLVAAGLEVTVLEALGTVLPFLPEPMRNRVTAEAERWGVPILTGTMVDRLEPAPGGGVRVLAGERCLEADLVMVAAGVRPASDLAAGAGLELGSAGAVAVDEKLRTSAQDIYAAGDCADARHLLTGRSVWVPLALRANRSGKLAGANAVGEDRTVPPILGTAVFRFFELEIARTGLSPAEAREAGFDTVEAGIRSPSRAGYIPGGGPLSVHLVGDRASRRLLGAALVGPESAAHRIDTLVTAIAGGMTAEDLYSQDLAYAPPFGPSWSPVLIAASKLMKALGTG